MANETGALQRRKVEAGTTIFAQGDSGEIAYLVEYGEVGIYKSIDGETIKLGVVKAGGIFGEMAVIDGSPRMAAAVAENSVLLVCVPKSLFDQKFASCDPFIRGLITIFLRNIRSAHRTYAKKPRSFADHLKLLDAYSLDLRSYVNSIEIDDFSPVMAQSLNDLEAAIQKVRAIADRPDRRQRVVDDADLEGVTLRSILDKG